jgi:hypothetical protein
MPGGETADPNRLFGARHEGKVKGKESIKKQQTASIQVQSATFITRT